MRPCDRLPCPLPGSGETWGLIRMEMAKRWRSTDVVMASHGRNSLTQLFLGGIASELVHNLRGTAIMVPVTATTSLSAGKTKEAPC